MFTKARLKLTMWYVLAIIVICFFFSGAIYKIQVNELQRIELNQRARINRQLQAQNMPPILFELEFLEDARKHLLVNLLYINGIILAISGVFAWVLSGKTLNPIRIMLDEQSRFVSDASHELKTPLTSLKTAFEVFNRTKKKTLKEASTIIEESVQEVNRLQELTNALLQLAQFQQPLSKQTFESSNIKTIIKTAVKKTEPLAMAKKISITIEGKGVKIDAIADELVHLFVILLENGIKYSHRKGSITVKIQQIRTDIAVHIEDHGIGISKDDIPRIFDRFFRSDETRTRSDMSGYGLGLSIAQHIVKKHRGTISVKSTLNECTTFTVRLPIRRLLQ